MEDRWTGSEPSGSHDGWEAETTDVDPRERVGREGHGHTVVAAAALEADNEVVEGTRIPKDGRVASERMANLDAVGFVGVNVGHGHGRVGREVKEVRGADDRVGGARSASYGAIEDIGQVVRVGDVPLVDVVEVGIQVKVGHGADQPGQDS